MNLKTDLPHEAIMNFLHYGSHTKKEDLTGEIHALKGLAKYLDQTSSLEEIFKPTSFGEETGYYLSSSGDKDRGYMICFGFVAGGDAGDGGEWSVSFDENNRIKRCDIVSAYIA